MPYVVTDDCILCLACLVGCPADAIEEGSTKCEIDEELCIDCGTCEANCPSEAIVFVELEELEPRG
jgi:NAD-dependent dihydropyrimidine dehydrogenase PreA subunit